MTNNSDFQTDFNKFKADFLKAVDTAAEEHGRTREEFLADAVANLILSVMFGRAARRGDVAKTIYWGLAQQNFVRVQRDRKAAVEKKRESNPLRWN